MPNWVTHKIKFTGKAKDIKALKKYVTTKENVFDFQKIIPMPASLNVTAGGDEQFAIRCAKHFKEHGLTPSTEYEESTWQKQKMSFADWVETGLTYLKNEQQYGAYDWYEWRIMHWGTKWNSCDAVWDSDDEVRFDTAWSTPVPIFHTLASLFPDVEIDVCYADEDLGNNCGTIWCKGEEYSVENVDSYSFACSVWGYDEEEMLEEE